MVGHDIQHEAHAFRLQRFNKLVELFRSADLRIDLGGIGDVISVRAPRSGLENRGSIEVGDTKVVKIIHKTDCVRESEVSIELQTIRSYRNSHDAFWSSGMAGTSTLMNKFLPQPTKCSTHSRATGSLATAFSSHAG